MCLGFRVRGAALVEPDCERHQQADGSTVVVLGEGPVAGALAAAVGSSQPPQSVVALEAAPRSGTWIAVVRPHESPGERCWWPMAEVALGAARIVSLAQDATSPPKIILVVEGLTSEPFTVQRPPLPSVLEFARHAGRVPLPPWAAEEPARELMLRAATSREDTRGLMGDAVALGEALLPGALFGVPRHGQANGWSEAIATVAEKAGAEVDPPTVERLAARLAQPDAAGAGEQVPVVLPPRPVRPGLVARRQQAVLWSGEVKFGNRWTTELMERLTQLLGVSGRDELLATMTGTAALRMCFEAAVGGAAAAQGKIAVLPAFTFAATAEALVQIGFRLRFADVDPVTWTLDPVSLEQTLVPGDVALVVPVDALGAPADHAQIAKVASSYGARVVADSAAALGSTYAGGPVAGLHWAHGYSLSFAKTLTAGGIGGLALAPKGCLGGGPSQWSRSSMMSEIHAVAALDQLDAFPQLVSRRNALAERYDAVIDDYPEVTRQRVRAGDGHSWVHYALALPDDASAQLVAADLAKAGVQTKRYYAPVLTDPEWDHQFDVGHGQATSAGLPVTDDLKNRVLALPMSSEFTESQIAQSVGALRRALDRLPQSPVRTERGKLR